MGYEIKVNVLSRPRAKAPTKVNLLGVHSPPHPHRPPTHPPSHHASPPTIQTFFEKDGNSARPFVTGQGREDEWRLPRGVLRFSDSQDRGHSGQGIRGREGSKQGHR